MTPVELHAEARSHTDTSVTTLMAWIANAQRLMDGGKLDSVAMSRMGELLLNACRYLGEREAAAKKGVDTAKRQADWDTYVAKRSGAQP